MTVITSTDKTKYTARLHGDISQDHISNFHSCENLKLIKYSELLKIGILTKLEIQLKVASTLVQNCQIEQNSKNVNVSNAMTFM